MTKKCVYLYLEQWLGEQGYDISVCQRDRQPHGNRHEGWLQEKGLTLKKLGFRTVDHRRETSKYAMIKAIDVCLNLWLVVEGRIRKCHDEDVRSRADLHAR